MVAVWAVTVAAANAAELAVTVKTGFKPIFGSTVTLYAAGNTRGSSAATLGAGLTNSEGKVRISYPSPASESTLYVLADGAPSTAVRLAAVLGPSGGANPTAVINELTTIATAYAMAQFTRGSSIAGPPNSLSVAAATAGRLTTARGEVAPEFAKQSALPAFHTLANLLASCVQRQEADSCRDLFNETKVPSAATAMNTLDAALSIARNPSNNVVPLYLLSPRNQPYSPSLSGSPEAWTLALTYAAPGAGKLAIDQAGSVWMTTSNGLSRLMPSGAGPPAASDAPSGGFGLGIDPFGRIWTSNHEASSVAVFDAAGMALSPAGGYREGRIRKPQGIQSDACGNIWVANEGSGGVTKYPKGDPRRAVVFQELDIRNPYGVATDSEGNIWVTGSAHNRVAKIDPLGKPVLGSPFIIRGLDKPLDIATDTLGNAWVTNQDGRSVTMIRPDGQETRNFTGGGIEGPWGIAVDGGDNIFVAKSRRPSLSILCGARPANCPLGMQTGDAISPATGYTATGLTRPSGVAIDGAGNVWVASHGTVVSFVGLARPLATPAIGPPRQPGQPLPACVEK